MHVIEPTRDLGNPSGTVIEVRAHFVPRALFSNASGQGLNPLAKAFVAGVWQSSIICSAFRCNSVESFAWHPMRTTRRTFRPEMLGTKATRQARVTHATGRRSSLRPGGPNCFSSRLRSSAGAETT